jgi:ubiquinol-cytochrome c reductase cytochrome b subunit
LNLISYSKLIISYLSQSRFNSIDNKKERKLLSSERIGPHNNDIISIIVGSTLGDTHLERRKNGKGTRIIFEQCNKNVEYLM